ncbi:MAG: glycosyltransferase [Ignavibacteria bacterium]|nr:MAG: glycosyltransferase [Ignavibacteria bacterium]
MMTEYILLGIFVILMGHYSLFLFSILMGLRKLKPSPPNQIPKEFVSIIIPFRNESENIISNIKSIIKQNFPKENYEVIYVDDSSTDNSLQILNDYPKPNNVKVLSLPKDYSPNAHKKRAIRYGIENSTGDIIMTTDADCFYSENWLSSMLSNMDAETGFISGPVEFLDDDGMFSKLQKLEFAGLVITGAGLIGIGKPTICNAANIAYRKKTYEEVNGFYDQMDLSSGDDELLMQKIAKDTKYKVKFSLMTESIVKTSANKNINDFYHQRKRWASKGLFYKNIRLIITLILIYLFYLGLIIQPFLILFISSSFAFSFGLSLVIKLILEYLVLLQGKNILFTKLSFKPFIFVEFLQIPYIIIAGFSGMFGNLEWKERKIKR